MPRATDMPTTLDLPQDLAPTVTKTLRAFPRALNERLAALVALSPRVWHTLDACLIDACTRGVELMERDYPSMGARKIAARRRAKKKRP